VKELSTLTSISFMVKLLVAVPSAVRHVKAQMLFVARGIKTKCLQLALHNKALSL